MRIDEPASNQLYHFTFIFLPYLTFTTQSRLLMTLRDLLKTLWEKEKMLETSIFSFSHNIFYPLQNKFQFFSCISFCRPQKLSI